ncbi:hypothetical protein [Streptomyces sp. BE230]|nr:hypothetical protein [Streptomyces sp. BE230]
MVLHHILVRGQALREGPCSLIYWHAEHPDDAVDHPSALPDRLAAPAYVR